MPHGLYDTLGGDPLSRQTAYPGLFHYSLEPGRAGASRKATNGNFALGDERFSDEIAMMLGRRAKPGRSGRPRKQEDPESLALL